MKLTLSWLKDHLDTNASLTEIAETLTRIGLEVEGVHNPGETLKDFVIARIVTAEQHPNADRLRVCQVETGQGETVQVVCGAPNARQGLVTVFAPPGTYIPAKDFTLSIGEIRGVKSFGMLCSGAELALSTDADGIMELPDNAPVGSRFAAYAGLDDPVIEINLTPNRADCTSIRGIARDLAATGIGDLKLERLPPVRGLFDCPVTITRDLTENEAHLNPLFALRLVRGVKNGPSPEWLQQRLTAIGLRPINTLVDITNYMTFDRGRPLHVFDAAKVKGQLVVRRAQKGESLEALDGKTYILDDTMIVIADDKGPEAIGGIIGGAATGCDEHTTDVLIESALWGTGNIAQTGRRLGIVTDARYRFERGVDPQFCLPGLDLATWMITDLCGGEPSSALLAGDMPNHDHIINFPWSEVRRLTGLDLPRPEAKVILTQLGFHISGMGDRVKVVPPSWRADVEGKADLVEEIVRIAGLDRVEPIPLPPLSSKDPKPKLTLLQKRTRATKRALATRGLMEAVTWSFIAHDEAVLFGGGDKRLKLANPIASDLSDMRPSLLPGLIKAAQRNADRGYSDIALFEVGQCFSSDEPDGQTIKAAGLRRGLARFKAEGRDWREGAGSADVFEVKADALTLLSSLGISANAVQITQGAPPFLHPGRSGMLMMGPRNPIGFFGEVHPKILKKLDVKGPLMVFEITLDALPPPKAKPTRMKPKLVLSDLQPLRRDFAFVADRDVAASEIIRAAEGADRQLITNIDLFDIYEGPNVGENQKSLAIAVTLQPRDKTLTDTEIETVSQKIIESVAKKTGAVLRQG